MVFSSITFLYYFLPILLIVYYLVPKKFRNIVLLIFSLIFYFYGEKNIILLLMCGFNYFLGKRIGKTQTKTSLAIGVICNILVLGYYKYCNFFIENINSLFQVDINYLTIMLPLGISFFTFQNISYLIDVYKQDVLPQKNLLNYATYITLFPQLIAGRTIRYKVINYELENRKDTFSQFSKGVLKFLVGLAKKVMIANQIGQMCVVLNAMPEKTVVSHILEAIGYTLQIYFDFSGYSDMAIGLGLFFGFNFKENFNYPLIANSITDFWRRWHISLSSFFRDYIYIPLGGNRVPFRKWIRNILVVWLLTGFWHGASWNFILWGGYFFIFLLIEKLFLNKFLKNNILSHLYTLIVIVISFVIFNITNLNDMFVFFKSMLGLNGLNFINHATYYYLKNYVILLVIAGIAATPLLKNIINKNKKVFASLEPVYFIGILLICTAMLLSNSFNPFIYFRF